MTDGRQHQTPGGIDDIEPAALLDSAAFEWEGIEYHYVAVGQPSAPATTTTLTRSEWDVAVRAMRGQSAKEIATARHTSERTVTNQLHSIYRKLDVCCRTDMVRVLLS